MLMLGQAQSLHSHNEPMFLSSNHQFAVNFHQSYFSSGDFCSPPIGTILKQHFRQAGYPSRGPLNPFCAFCLRYIGPSENFLVYRQPLFSKSYLAHSQCLKSQESSCLNTLLEDITQARVTFANETNYKQLISYDDVQYYIELELSHCLTSKKYFTLKDKLTSVDGTQIIWNLHQPASLGPSMPNIVAFPFPDFDLTLTYSKVSQRQSQICSKAHVNMSLLKTECDSLVKVSTDEMELIARVIQSESAKKQLIQEMNYKYRYPIDINCPLIQLIKLEVRLRTEEEEEVDDYICSQENSSITELLNQNSSCYSSYQSTYPYNRAQKKVENAQINSDKSFGKEKVNLSWLIGYGKLGQYVRNNAQSRNFQASLNDFTQEQLNQIIDALSGEFRELVTHEYANYMMQKLFARCNQRQRMMILREIMADLPIIAMSTQGTHTLQSFLPAIVQDEERGAIIERIRSNIPQISLHSNATHFLQKAISVFPLGSLLPIYKIVVKKFVQFSLDKNAMCVLKQLMRKISGGPSQQSLIRDLQKSFINALLLNLDRIIQDAFGNYVVQFAYEFFGEIMCAGITQIIIQRFQQYSIQKYSGSVINKCLENYWDCLNVAERLKLALNAQAIIALYRSKEGNKTLLILLEKCEGTALREKICAQLTMVEPSKFQHERWGLVLGSRSWTTGAEYASFTQAMKPRGKKRKLPHNIQ